MPKTLTISQARSRLLNLAQELEAKPQEGAVTITKRGKPVLALMNWELYESIMETLEIMSDEKLLAAVRRGLKDIDKGRVYHWEEVKKELGL